MCFVVLLDTKFQIVMSSLLFIYQLPIRTLNEHSSIDTLKRVSRGTVPPNFGQLVCPLPDFQDLKMSLLFWIPWSEECNLSSGNCCFLKTRKKEKTPITKGGAMGCWPPAGGLLFFPHFFASCLKPVICVTFSRLQIWSD